MKLLGLLGWPVGHSVSPAMMTAAFAHTNQQAVYVPFAVPKGREREAVFGLAALGALGCNVTIPHKQTVMQAVDEFTSEAASAGAVNTIRIDPERRTTIGHNTDIDGWWESVRPILPGLPDRVAVLGAGGGTRAVLAALQKHAPHSKIIITARRTEVVAALQADFAPLHVASESWADRHRVIQDADLVVQATPIGMWPNTEQSPIDDERCFRPGQVVQDLVYRPFTTAMLKQAQQRGAVTVDGLGMLVNQGALSFRFWFGVDAPVEVMRKAALHQLSTQG